MGSNPGAITTRLANSAVALQWQNGQLSVENHVSGSTHVFDFPAFSIILKGQPITPGQCEFRDFSANGDTVTFNYAHPASGIEIAVCYALEGDKPWFRKRLRLTAPPGTPTPDRVYVDIQSAPPSPIRRVGYGLRGGPDAEEQTGLETYAEKPACGYPVYAGDWFFGLEHASGFAVPGDALNLYHHPVWDADGRIESFSAVVGSAADHAGVPEAFMDYLWHIRNPRLSEPLYMITTGWSTHALGGGDYVCDFESINDFLDAMVGIGLRPDAFAVDAGYFDRASIFQGKDDPDDSRLRALKQRCTEEGMKFSLWVSHNGRTGLDMDWIKQQGWLTGDGPGTYRNLEFVVMMQPSFEEALARRFETMVGEIGVDHLKIDWDNECATSEEFSEVYPTVNHVREASLLAFNRIDARMRAKNPELITRNGWWPSPWWLTGADHVWLADSGDLEYAVWPSRTQRDRDNTHRDACYYQHLVKAETPVPLDAWDNHGFVDAVDCPFHTEPHTWLDNLVLQFTRGTTYLHMPFCPETIRDWQAQSTQAGLEWLRYHASEFGTRHSRMVLGNPGFGEVYGYLHPFDDGAWLTLRNPSVEPQMVALPLQEWLGYSPGTLRQVYPYWEDLQAGETWLLGHEVVLLRIYREKQAEVSPIPGSGFMVRPAAEGYEYLFPGNRRLTDEIGPTVHESMQMPDFSIEQTADEAIEGGWRMMWYAGIPHRFEKAEVLITLRGPQEVLDGVTVRGGNSRYRTVPMRHYAEVTRIFRQEERGHGTVRWLPPVGPRERDDYVFSVPDGGWSSITVDVLGDRANELVKEVWLTGYEATARQTIVRDTPPTDGPLWPMHPHGFSRHVRMK